MILLEENFKHGIVEKEKERKELNHYAECGLTPSLYKI